MNLDLFWERIFSEQAPDVRAAWEALDPEEQESVRQLLREIAADEGRVIEQRRAAGFALEIVGAAPGSDGLPPGALAFARELARDAGIRLRKVEGLLVATLKKDGTLVTEFDIEADRKISGASRERYPDHGVLSEEQAHVFGGEEWVWVIDPIDGTSNFTWGFPTWGVLIGLLHHGTPVMGVADFPMIGHQYYGIEGVGAWLNDDPIRAAQADSLQPTQLFSACSRTLKFGKPNLPMKARISGSTGFDLAMLARGSVVGVIQQSVHVWDVAAMWPIVRAAGAQVASNLSEGLVPLIKDLDYGDIGFAILGACNETLEASVRERLSDRFKPIHALQGPGL